MLGRIVRLFAATAVLTLGGLSAASAGGFGYGGYYGGYGLGYGGYGVGGYGFGNGCCGPTTTVADWGCGTSCAPLSSFYSYNCCAPVRWGCGNPCGSYAYQQPIYVVPQGPLYQPPLTGYTYPVSTYEGPRPYPYVSGYYGYRSAYQPYRRVAHYGYPAMRRHYAPRRYYRAIELPLK